MSQPISPSPQWIIPQWDVPHHIKAMVTTRLGGYSRAPWDGFNLGLHVDDDANAVAKNRAELLTQLPAQPHWLEQVHSSRVVDISDLPLNDKEAPICADGAFSQTEQRVCVVMTADCLPILISNNRGDAVMALHAGWRGLAGAQTNQPRQKADHENHVSTGTGIVEQGVELFIKKTACSISQLQVWLGPAIGPQAFEVGEEVLDAFQSFMPSEAAFKPINNEDYPGSPDTCDNWENPVQNPKQPKKWLADIYQLARLRLQRLGVYQIFGLDSHPHPDCDHYCTYQNQRQFYSYRRDGVTGRMATLIWIDKSH